MDFSHLREEYPGKGLDPSLLKENPEALLSRWVNEASKQGTVDANAFVLATASKEGKPSTRTVLMKELLPEGILFFTSSFSRKAKEIAENPYVSGLFLYRSLSRQILFEGIASLAPREKSISYFAKRPRASQISAVASKQGESIDSRNALERRFQEIEHLYRDQPIPCPSDWTGFFIKLEAIEFWQGMENRLHDRIRFIKKESSWQASYLMP